MPEMKTADVFSELVDLPKEEFAKELAKKLKSDGYDIVEVDFKRPWGGFVRISDRQSDKFLEEYFAEIDLPATTETATLSPKFLIIEPGKKNSWQVHERRGEFWGVLVGPVGVYRSDSDAQPQFPEVHKAGETIDLPVGTRHRYEGLDNRGILTEIWIHTDPDHLSNEEDIRRIADDFGRESK